MNRPNFLILIIIFFGVIPNCINGAIRVIDVQDVVQGSTNGAVTIQARGDAGPFTAYIVNEQDIKLIESKDIYPPSGFFDGFIRFDGLAPGLHSIYVTDAYDCVTVLTAEIGIKPCELILTEVDINHNSFIDFCDPDNSINDGSIEISVESNGDYEITWDGPPFFTSPTEQTLRIENLFVGSYGVSISSSDGDCIIERSFDITYCQQNAITTYFPTIDCSLRTKDELDFEVVSLRHASGSNTCDGYIDISISELNNTYSFWWENSIGQIISNDLFVDGLCGGQTYFLVIDDGCSENLRKTFVIENCNEFAQNIEFTIIENETCDTSAQIVQFESIKDPNDVTNNDFFTVYIYQDEELIQKAQTTSIVNFNLDIGIYDFKILTSCGNVISHDNIEVGTSLCENLIDYRVVSDRWYINDFSDLNEVFFSKDCPCGDCGTINGIFDQPDIRLNMPEGNNWLNEGCSISITWPDDETTTIIKESGQIKRTGRTKFNVNIDEFIAEYPITVTLSNGCSESFIIPFTEYRYLNGWETVGLGSFFDAPRAYIGYYECSTCIVAEHQPSTPSIEQCRDDYNFRPFTYKPYSNSDPCAGGLFYYMYELPDGGLREAVQPISGGFLLPNG